MYEIKYRKADEMKDSGVEWLDNIPQNWDLIKLKYLSIYKTSNVDKLTVKGEYPILLCNYVDVYKNSAITEYLDFMQATATKQEIRNFTLKGGYILITKDSESPNDIGIPAYVPNTLPGVLCGYHLSIIDTDQRRLNPRYLFHLFCSKGARNYFETRAKGITRYSLNMESFRNIIIPVVSPKEQQKIANFLDIKTAQFDSIIAKKELLIQKLEKAKKSLISEVVTGKVKIVDGEIVPRQPEEMRDSGVEWIGTAPMDWVKTKLKYIAWVRNGATPQTSVPEYWYGNICWFTPTDFGRQNLFKSTRTITRKGLNSCGTNLVPKGSILITCRAPIGNLGIVDCKNAAYNQGCKGVIPRYVDNKYLFYLLLTSSKFLQSRGKGTTFMELSSFDLNNLIIEIPDEQEQQKIANFLDIKTAQFDSIIAKKELLIQKLKKAQQSLISEAVTGKIDLRDWEIIEEGELE